MACDGFRRGCAHPLTGRRHVMLPKKPGVPALDPFSLFRQLAVELDPMFDVAARPALRWPCFHVAPAGAAATWFPQVDVFERDHHLIAKVDLPGVKKQDVKVEVADGHLVISGERKAETEEKREHFYRLEREYGCFA